MSLAFLAKKSWHTSTIKNVEKVWIAEQKKEAENKKLAELQKQLIEERQMQELRQLQAANGHVTQEVDNSLDWMYSGPSAQQQQQQQSNEEFLLGKIYQPKNSQASMSEALQPEVLSLQSSKPSWENKVMSKNDAFTRIHEDPLLLIKQQEKKTRENILSNPIKLAKLREQVESTMRAREVEKKASKKSHKEDKKGMKHSKKEKKHRDRDDDFDRDRKRDHSPISRHRSSYDNDHHIHRHHEDERRSRDDSRDRKHDRREFDIESNRKRHRSESSDRRGPGHRHRSCSSSPPSKRHDDHHKDTSTRQHIAGYGLIKGKSSADSTSSSRSNDGDGNYGPKQDLIQKRIERERLELAHKKSQSQRSQPLTAEEREQRIREMEDNAKESEELRLRRLQQAIAATSAEEQAMSQDRKADAKFLKSMRSEVYNNADISMADRLKQNRHYSQRGTDLDSHGFMNK